MLDSSRNITIHWHTHDYSDKALACLTNKDQYAAPSNSAWLVALLLLYMSSLYPATAASPHKLCEYHSGH